MRTPGDIAARAAASAWYRQPVVWLGIAVFAASLAGCVWLIVLGARHADIPLETAHQVFGVPVGTHSSAAAPAASSP